MIKQRKVAFISYVATIQLKEMQHGFSIFTHLHHRINPRHCCILDKSFSRKEKKKAKLVFSQELRRLKAQARIENANQII